MVPACATLFPQLWGRRWLVTSLTMQHCWGKSRDQLVILINGTELLCLYIYCIDIYSKFDARQAFASYLEHVQNRLLKNTRYNSYVTIPEQLYVIFFFSKQYLHTSSWHREGPGGKWHCSLQSSPPLKCGLECDRPCHVAIFTEYGFGDSFSEEGSLKPEDSLYRHSSQSPAATPR